MILHAPDDASVREDARQSGESNTGLAWFGCVLSELVVEARDGLAKDETKSQYNLYGTA